MRTKQITVGCALALGVAVASWPLAAAATEPKPEGTTCYATEVCSSNPATCDPATYGHGNYNNIAVNTNDPLSSGGDQGDSTPCGTHTVIGVFVVSCGGYEIYTSCQ